MLDFKDIAASALNQSEYFVPLWLPNGKKRGSEWVIGDLDGNPGESLSINLRTGLWSDFSTGDKGGDLISLYAAVYRVRYKEAAESIANNLGMVSQAKPKKITNSEKSPWKPIMPVPTDAAPVHKAHPVRGTYTHKWTYLNQKGELLGYVCRFTDSSGKKEILPLVYAEDKSRNPSHFPVFVTFFGSPETLLLKSIS